MNVLNTNETSNEYTGKNAKSPNDMLVVTILIQMHGTVITFDLDPETAAIFDNVRLSCASKGLNEYESGTATNQFGLNEEYWLTNIMSNLYKKDIDTSTFDIIRNEPATLLGNVTFDKLLSNNSGYWFDITNNWQGIYVISVHRGRQLIYPVADEPIVNLLNIKDLQRFADFFEYTIHPLDDSNRLPNKDERVNKEYKITSDKNLSEKEKIKQIEQIRNTYMNDVYKWNVTLNNNKNIEQIKLSYLVWLVKQILGNNIIINLLDYSCSGPTPYISNKQTSKYAIQPHDEEMGTPYQNLGGKRKKTRRHKKRKYTRKKRQKRK